MIIYVHIIISHNIIKARTLFTTDYIHPKTIDIMSLKREGENDDLQNKSKKIRSVTEDHELSTNEEKLEITETEKCNQYDPRCMLHIGDEVYVVAKKYNGELQIHIRQFNRFDRSTYPTKKGVTLSLLRWRVLELRKDNIDKYFQDFYEDLGNEEQSIHLGGGIYATMNYEYPVVNIRHWWKPNEGTEPKPTKRGIILNNAKWKQLKNAMDIMRDFVPELNSVSDGCDQIDHQNQIGMLRCKECNPFDYVNY